MVTYCKYRPHKLQNSLSCVTCQFWSLSVPYWSLFFRWNFLSKLNPTKAGTPSWTPNNYDTDAIKIVSLRLTHDDPHVCNFRGYLILATHFLSFIYKMSSKSPRNPERHSRGGNLKSLGRLNSALPTTRSSSSFSLQLTFCFTAWDEERVTSPENACSSHRLSFLCSSAF